jgi:membrane associated rhomboid family serine protease
MHTARYGGRADAFEAARGGVSVRQNSFYDIYPVTSVLLLLIGGFFVLELIGHERHAVDGPGLPVFDGIHRQVLNDLGWSLPALVREGEYWRLLASTFLHANLFHFVMNAGVLLDLGRLCEPKISSPKFFTVYVASGLGGSLAGYGLRLLVESPNPSVGASGAICGLIGLWLVYSIKEHQTELRNALLRWIGFMAILSFALWYQLDHFAHLGGFATGALLGLTMKEVTTSAEARCWRLPAYAAAVLVAASLALAVWNHGRLNWDWAGIW